MRNKSVLIVIIVLVSAAVLALLYMLDGSDEGAQKLPGKKNKNGKIVKKKNNWEKKYGHRNIDPYGTFIFYNLLKASNPKKVRVLKRSTQYEWLDTIKKPGKLYMYVGTSFPDNRFHLKRVLEMVKRGNSAFISAEVWPDRIMRMINRTHQIYATYGNSFNSFFEHPAFEDNAGAKFNYVYKNRAMSHYWAYFYPHRPVVMRVALPGVADTVIKDIWIPEGKYVVNQTTDEYDESDDYSDEDESSTGDETGDRLLDSINKVLENYRDANQTVEEAEEPNDENQEESEFDWTNSMRSNYTDEEWEEYKSVYNDTVDVYARSENKFVQFMSVKYGKGRIYLHTMPYSLTNLVLKREKGLQYAERVITCLPEHEIYFDSFLASVKSNSYHGENAPQGDLYKRASPLQFILRERSFRWAWYILLASVLLYILFKGKRKQQIIDPVQPVSNNHLEFSNTLSKLYMQRGQPGHIIKQQERNFQFYVRRKYYLNISRNPSEEEIAQLSRKSSIETERIRSIYDRFKKAKANADTGVKDLTELYQQLEYFYKNCR